MQALIDFDGWRKWKDFAGANREANKTTPATDSAAKLKERKAKRVSRASIDGPGITRPAADAAQQNGIDAALGDTLGEAL